MSDVWMGEGEVYYLQNVLLVVLKRVKKRLLRYGDRGTLTRIIGQFASWTRKNASGVEVGS